MSINYYIASSGEHVGKRDQIGEERGDDPQFVFAFNKDYIVNEYKDKVIIDEFGKTLEKEDFFDMIREDFISVVEGDFS